MVTDEAAPTLRMSYREKRCPRQVMLKITASCTLTPREDLSNFTLLSPPPPTSAGRASSASVRMIFLQVAVNIVRIFAYLQGIVNPVSSQPLSTATYLENYI